MAPGLKGCMATPTSCAYPGLVPQIEIRSGRGALGSVWHWVHATRPELSELVKMFSEMLGIGRLEIWRRSRDIRRLSRRSRQPARQHSGTARAQKVQKPARHCVTAFTTSVPTMSSCPLPQSSVQSTL